MIPTYEQRESKFQTAPPAVQYLYASEEVGRFLRGVFNEYRLAEKEYYDYALAFGDVVLGFEEESHLPQLLVERVGLPEKLATIIAHDLLEYINTHKSSPPQPASTQAPEPSAPLAHLV